MTFLPTCTVGCSFVFSTSSQTLIHCPTTRTSLGGSSVGMTITFRIPDDAASSAASEGGGAACGRRKRSASSRPAGGGGGPNKRKNV
jgi:hypothetical protein